MFLNMVSNFKIQLLNYWLTGGGSVGGSLKNLAGQISEWVRVVGVIACLIGAGQFGISMMNQHDASQKSNGTWFIVGGLIMFFHKELLSVIGVKW